jgi:hypothetical protein
LARAASRRHAAAFTRSHPHPPIQAHTFPSSPPHPPIPSLYVANATHHPAAQFTTADARLARYEASLVRELGRWEGVPRTRAAALAKARDTGRSKLLLLYTWGLWDVMDVFRAQVSGA